MKLRKKSKNMEMHKRRYIKLSVVLFAISFIFNTWQFLAGWDSAGRDVAVSPLTGALALFVSAAMMFMGLVYLRIK